MTFTNPVQDRLDKLSDTEAQARRLLDRTLRLAGLRLDHHRPAGAALRLAVCFHRRADQAAAEEDDCVTHLERMDGR
ncbi:hypothetical protein [Streptacidiphilus fuscans]|uniref:Uncharacterized protein n=1 Tax=Streptacidiphilus fuscans TaxID=2789292 RepID=A0A931BCW7_9ACTN|nr:hypothetical protein [Streptacidiphilus fuscans]MBF9071903.1 hypothetical protein [Streptacidiphilus fuscans]